MRRTAAALFRITFLLSVLSTVSALAGPLDEGAETYRREDYVETFRTWKPLAGQGNAVAQNNMGAMYANGKGVQQDYAEALKWYRLAAEQEKPGLCSLENDLCPNCRSRASRLSSKRWEPRGSGSPFEYGDTSTVAHPELLLFGGRRTGIQHGPIHRGVDRTV